VGAAFLQGSRGTSQAEREPQPHGGLRLPLNIRRETFPLAGAEVDPGHVRLAYRVSYLLFFASAHLAAWLAAHYRAAARAERLAPILVPLQLALLEPLTE